MSETEVSKEDCNANRRGPSERRNTGETREAGVDIANERSNELAVVRCVECRSHLLLLAAQHDFARQDQRLAEVNAVVVECRCLERLQRGLAADVVGRGEERGFRAALERGELELSPGAKGRVGVGRESEAEGRIRGVLEEGAVRGLEDGRLEAEKRSRKWSKSELLEHEEHRLENHQSQNHHRVINP